MNLNLQKQSSAENRFRVSKKLSKPELLGLLMVEQGGLVEKTSDRLYLVRDAMSNGGSKTYRVRWKTGGSWSCNCIKTAEERRRCRHVHAVNFLLRLPEILMANSGALDGEWRCPHCGSGKLAPYGSRYNKSGSVRRYKCPSCKRTCKDPTTHQDLSSKIALVIIALDLFYKKLSYREVQDHLVQIYGIHKPVSTIRNWILKFTRIVTDAVKRLDADIRPGSKWLADEMVLRVSGKRMHLWTILDFKTRRQVVSILLQGRGSREASKVIIEALKKTGGKKPGRMLTDGLQSYVSALKEEGIPHVANVALADKKNNNRVERLHGSIRQFVKAKRGLKGNAPLLLEGYSSYYNYIRPHMSLSERSPVRIGRGKVRWSTLLSEDKS